jgi:hypothetical protein
LDQKAGAALRASHASIGIRFLIAAIAAASLSALLLVLDGSHLKFLSVAGEMRLFQRTVGGLGMGASAAPAWNLIYFDPRLQPVDDSNLWPIAGSYPYSPSAVATAVTFRELPREDLRIIKVGQ